MKRLRLARIEKRNRSCDGSKWKGYWLTSSSNGKKAAGNGGSRIENQFKKGGQRWELPVR